MDIEYLNKEETISIYEKCKEIEPYYEKNPQRYCADARLVVERVLKYTMMVLGEDSDIRCGRNLNKLRDLTSLDLFPEKIYVEFSQILNTTNKYHHDDEDVEIEPGKDRLTIERSLEYILPWASTFRDEYDKYLRKKKKDEKGCLIWSIILFVISIPFFILGLKKID